MEKGALASACSPIRRARVFHSQRARHCRYACYAVARSNDGLRKLQGESDGKVKDRFTLRTVDLADIHTIDGLGKFVENGWGRTDVRATSRQAWAPLMAPAALRERFARSDQNRMSVDSPPVRALWGYIRSWKQFEGQYSCRLRGGCPPNGDPTSHHSWLTPQKP